MSDSLSVPAAATGEADQAEPPMPGAVSVDAGGPRSAPETAAGGPGHGDRQVANARPNGEIEGGCTLSQLRRFIKSRPYVPLHELRRRFAIDGPDDDVTAIDTAVGRVYVGLPNREGRLIGDLVAQGDIGYELLLDPDSPVIIGVYPMRPVPRS